MPEAIGHGEKGKKRPPRGRRRLVEVRWVNDEMISVTDKPYR
jgi:hypothetical protein